jgi:hypothetical protein
MKTDGHLGPRQVPNGFPNAFSGKLKRTKYRITYCYDFIKLTWIYSLQCR